MKGIGRGHYGNILSDQARAILAMVINTKKHHELDDSVNNSQDAWICMEKINSPTSKKAGVCMSCMIYRCVVCLIQLL